MPEQPNRVNRPVELSRGQEGMLNRLRDSSAKIESMERHLAAECRRRDLLLLKGTTSGLTTRHLGAVAGMSSPAVTYATRRALAAHAQMLREERERGLRA